MTREVEAPPLLWCCPPLVQWISEATCEQNAVLAEQPQRYAAPFDPLLACRTCPGVRRLYDRGETPAPRIAPAIPVADPIAAAATVPVDPRARAGASSGSRKAPRSVGAAKGTRSKAGGPAEPRARRPSLDAPPSPLAERNARIYEERTVQGLRFSEIAKRHGISKPRAVQIVGKERRRREGAPE